MKKKQKQINERKQLIKKPTKSSRVFNRSAIQSLGFQAHGWAHLPATQLELLLRSQSGRHLPWPTTHDPNVLVVSPLNNMMRRVSTNPVHPSMSWWNDFRGFPTGFEDPEFQFAPTPGSDDYSFPAVPGTSGLSTIIKFNQIHNRSNERVTLLDLLMYMTENDDQLGNLTTMYTVPTTTELSENKKRLQAWDQAYKLALKDGKDGVSAFGKREDDFSTAQVSIALKQVAVMTPQLEAMIKNEELNSSKQTRRSSSKKTSTSNNQKAKAAPTTTKTTKKKTTKKKTTKKKTTKKTTKQTFIDLKGRSFRSDVVDGGPVFTLKVQDQEGNLIWVERVDYQWDYNFVCAAVLEYEKERE